MNAPQTPLQYLMPSWFAIVMGWTGLALAWHRAHDALGEIASTVSRVIGAAALVLFLLLSLLSLWRWQRHTQAVRDDVAHPVRHAFFAAIPISVLLLAILGVLHYGPDLPGLHTLWLLGSVSQIMVTLWALSRWLRPTPWNWTGITPALFLPIVGNVLAPLAGVPLGYAAWSTAQLGVGLLFWPILSVLIIVRIAQIGMLPPRLLPMMFIFVAPPAVIGMASFALDAPLTITWLLWGMALFSAFWAAVLTPRIAKLSFGLAHWGMSFPLAALSVLTLRLSAAPEGAWLVIPGVILLALVSLIILGLSWATLRGLWAGTLLVPEPVAPTP